MGGRHRCGGATIKGALVDQHGRVTRLEPYPTRREEGPEAVVTRILDFAMDLVMRCRETYGSDALAGVGVGVPGLVDEAAGVAVASTNLGWQRVPLRDLLAGRTGLPVFLGHDVRLGALAEGLVGAARGSHDYLFLTLGTGVGAALVLNGQPYVGSHGTGGEFGHMVVVPGGPQCLCGKVGCVEAIASASALERRYSKLGNLCAPIPAQEVAKRAEAGDPVAMQVWGDAVSALGDGISNYITLLDPERVVIGGGMATAGARLFDPLIRAVAGGVRFQEVPPIVPAVLGQDAGCCGAALHAWLALGATPADLAHEEGTSGWQTKRSGNVQKVRHKRF